MSFLFPDLDEDPTKKAMLDPQVGDCFTEMYVYWVIVIDRTPLTVTTYSFSRPCVLPDDGEVNQYSLSEFSTRYQYSPDNYGYWVRLYKRDADISMYRKMLNW